MTEWRMANVVSQTGEFDEIRIRCIHLICRAVRSFGGVTHVLRFGLLFRTQLLGKSPTELGDLETVSQTCVERPYFCTSNYLTLSCKPLKLTGVQQAVTVTRKIRSLVPFPVGFVFALGCVGTTG